MISALEFLLQLSHSSGSLAELLAMYIIHFLLFLFILHHSMNIMQFL